MLMLAKRYAIRPSKPPPLTNHQKGRVGEATVLKTLAEQCPDWEVRDASRNPAESDIHLVNARGELIVFECKYKRIITLQDTDKSCRDIHHLGLIHGAKLIGYMFVSLRSLNIPHRGFYEQVDGVPTLWVGMDDASAPYLLPRTVQMMLRLAQDMRLPDGRGGEVRPDARGQVEAAVKTNRRTLLAAKRTMAKLQQHVLSLESQNDALRDAGNI